MSDLRHARSRAVPARRPTRPAPRADRESRSLRGSSRTAGSSVSDTEDIAARRVHPLTYTSFSSAISYARRTIPLVAHAGSVSTGPVSRHRRIQAFSRFGSGRPVLGERGDLQIRVSRSGRPGWPGRGRHRRSCAGRPKLPVRHRRGWTRPAAGSRVDDEQRDLWDALEGGRTPRAAAPRLLLFSDASVRTPITIPAAHPSPRGLPRNSARRPSAPNPRRSLGFFFSGPGLPRRLRHTSNTSAGSVTSARSASAWAA